MLGPGDCMQASPKSNTVMYNVERMLRNLETFIFSGESETYVNDIYRFYVVIKNVLGYFNRKGQVSILL